MANGKISAKQQEILEYIKSEMKKGTYEEIHYQPMTFIPYENFAYDEDEMSEEED